MRAELDELNRREPRGIKRAREESAASEEVPVKTEGAASSMVVKVEESMGDEENINWEE